MTFSQKTDTDVLLIGAGIMSATLARCCTRWSPRFG